MSSCRPRPISVAVYEEEGDNLPTSILFPAGTPPDVMESIFGSLPTWRYDTPVDDEYRASGLYRFHEPWAVARITSFACGLVLTIQSNRIGRGWQAASPEVSMARSLEDLECLLETLDDYRQVPWAYQLAAWERAASFEFEEDGLPLNPYPDCETTVEYIMADIYREARRLVRTVVYAPELHSEEEWA